MNSYFSHDSNARNDEKIARLRMKHGSAGYGVYFMILERLREAKDYMSIKDYNLIAFDLRDDSQLIKSVVEDFGLFAFVTDKDRGECFYSKSFNDRMVLKDEKSKKRAEAGKRGAAKRWDSKDKAEPSNNNSNAIAKPSKDNSNAIAKPSKKIASKEKESKEKESKVNKNNDDDGAREPLVNFDEQKNTNSRESFELWEQLWGFPNAIAIPAIDEWIATMGDDMLKLAIEYAGSRNVQAKGALKYVTKIIDGWKQRNIGTVAEAEQASREHEQRMSNARGGQGRPNNVRETLPDWAKDDYKPAPAEPVAEPELTPELAAEMQKIREFASRKETEKQSDD